MTEDEQILAIFVNRITYITGSTKVAERVRKRIVQWKNQLWLLSIVFWSVILFLWLK